MIENWDSYPSESDSDSLTDSDESNDGNFITFLWWKSEVIFPKWFKNWGQTIGSDASEMRSIVGGLNWTHNDAPLNEKQHNSVWF